MMNRKTAAAAILVALCISTACSQSTPQNKASQTKQQATDQGNVFDLNRDHYVLSLRNINGIPYFHSRDFARAMNYMDKWDEAAKSYQLGNHDPVFQVETDSLQARKADKSVTMSVPPRLLEGELYLPVTALKELFGDDVNYSITGTQVRLLSNPSFYSGRIQEQVRREKLGGSYRMDLDRNGQTKVQSADKGLEFAEDLKFPLPADQSTHVDKLIEAARRYAGVPYEFGAGPYSQTGKFDCSSFTQHVYGKFGVNLKRESRAQAAQGVAVGRNELRKGDLLFFSVADRFKINKEVDHVGIYMGNMKMIHASPTAAEFGVVISPLDQGYWDQTFVTARRIAF